MIFNILGVAFFLLFCVGLSAGVREAIRKKVFLLDIVWNRFSLGIASLREDIQNKKASLLWAMSKGGGGVQPESKSFEVVFLSPILTNFWTLNGGRGQGLPWSESFEALFVWIFWILGLKKVSSRLSKMGLYKSYLTMSKMKGGGASRPLLDNVQKKDIFFRCLPSSKEENILNCVF